MNCGCIKNQKFDFILRQDSPGQLAFRDQSGWIEDEGYSVPETYQLYVQPPGHKEFKVVDVVTSDINILHPKDLGLRGHKFPDGLYCFKIGFEGVGCGRDQYQHRALTGNIECCLKSFTVQAAKERDQNKHQQMFSDIGRIRTYVSAIHDDGRFGASDSLRRLYGIVNEFLRQSNCDCK